LLADDSMTIQKLVEMAFVDTEHELICLSNGQDAWEKMAEFHPHVVLADAIMPVLDGYSLCERIKESDEFSSVPVVLLTGRFQPYDEKRASDARIDSRIMKPFVQEQLVELVEKLAGPSEPEVESSPVDQEEMSPLEAEITEDVPFTVVQDNVFEEDELESIDDDFMEEVPMEDEEIPQHNSPETPSQIDTNSTIRVNQEELQSFLHGNVSLSQEDNENDGSQAIDSFDLDEVDEFTEDDFLNEENAIADTVESELDTTAYVDNKDTLVEPEQPEPQIPEAASSSVTEEDSEELDSVDDFLLDDEDDFLEDELEDIELEEVDELLDLDEYDSMNEDGEEWGDILEEPVSEPGDDLISNNLNELDVTESEPHSMEAAGESLPSLEDVSDATLSLDRDEMNDILTNEQNVVDALKEEEKDSPFTVDEEDPFEPDFLTKNTLPLDELEDELNLESGDDADTLPLETGEEESIDIEEMDSQITEPLDNEPGLSSDIPEELDTIDEDLSSDQGSFEIEEDIVDTETDSEDFLGGTIEDVGSPDKVVKTMAGGEDTIPRSMITDYMESSSENDDPIQEPSGFEDSPATESADVLELGQPELLENEDEVTELLDVEPDDSEITMPDEFEPLEEEEDLSWHDESTSVSTIDSDADEFPAYEEDVLSDSNDPGQENTEELLFDNDPDAIDEIDTPSDDLSIESEIDDPVRLPDAEPFAMEEPSELDTEQLDDDPELVFEEEEPDFMQDMEEELEVQVEEVEEPFEMKEELNSPDFTEDVPIEASVSELSEEIADNDEPEISESTISTEVPESSPVLPEVQELSKGMPEVEDEFVAAPSQEDTSVVRLSDEQLDILVNKVAEKVIQALSSDAVKEVAWEVVPALAEVMVERRIFELEKDDQGTS